MGFIMFRNFIARVLDVFVIICFTVACVRAILTHEVMFIDFVVFLAFGCYVAAQILNYCMK